VSFAPPGVDAAALATRARESHDRARLFVGNGDRVRRYQNSVIVERWPVYEVPALKRIWLSRLFQTLAGEDSPLLWSATELST